MKPGEKFIDEGNIEANAGKATVKLTVSNSGDRPVQIGSHFHFFEVNRALKFDREKAYGMRLNIPSGTAVRFEPGQSHDVELVAYGGAGVVNGFNRLVEGNLRDNKSDALNRMKAFEQGD